MGVGDRASNAAEDLKGKAKEGVGSATGNDRMEAEGKGDQLKSSIKDGIEDVKDKAAEAINKVTHHDDKRA